MKDILVIVNPNAGTGEKELLIEEIEARLLEHFDKVIVLRTQEEDQATEFTLKAGERGMDSILVFGGDGTINEVVQGLVQLDAEKRPKLAILPGGTGNLLARALNYSTNPERALEQIDFNRSKKLDIGLANNQVFTLTLSIGAIPEAIHDSEKEDKKKFGMFAYFTSIASKLVDRDVHNINLTIGDECKVEEVDHLVISLTDYVVGFRVSNHDITQGDGMANIFIIKDVNLLEAASIAGSVLINQSEENEHIALYQAKELILESADGQVVPTDLDGDKGPNLPVHVQILQEAIEVYLPKE